MSEDGLFQELNEVLSMAGQTIDMEAMMRHFLMLSHSIGAFRASLITQGFSEEWTDEACMILFCRVIGNDRSEEHD